MLGNEASNYFVFSRKDKKLVRKISMMYKYPSLFHGNMHNVIKIMYPPKNLDILCFFFFFYQPPLLQPVPDPQHFLTWAKPSYRRAGTGPAVQPGALPAAYASSSFLEKSNNSTTKSRNKQQLTAQELYKSNSNKYFNLKLGFVLVKYPPGSN